MDATKVFSVRCAPDEHAAWVAAAGSGSLNAWIRGRLNSAVGAGVGMDDGGDGLLKTDIGDDQAGGLRVNQARSESSEFKAPAGPRGFKRGGPDPKVKKYPARKKEGS